MQGDPKRGGQQLGNDGREPASPKPSPALLRRDHIPGVQPAASSRKGDGAAPEVCELPRSRSKDESGAAELVMRRARYVPDRTANQGHSPMSPRLSLQRPAKAAAIRFDPDGSRRRPLPGQSPRPPHRGRDHPQARQLPGPTHRMLSGSSLVRRRIGRPFIPVETCRGHIRMLGLGRGRAGNGIKCSLRVHRVDRSTVGKRVLPSGGRVDEDHAADRADVDELGKRAAATVFGKIPHAVHSWHDEPPNRSTPRSLIRATPKEEPNVAHI